ncbi:MAG: formylglycine-generating enzyme family protein [Opitutales bacterium]|nr:formylglycine-generating enzyme family protein [Opitutales bacterium]
MIVALGEGIALPMIWLDSGTFTMGSPLEEQGRWSDEGPQTRVRITRGFWIGKYPVTQEQWEAVMGNNPSRFTDRGPQAPVDYVSWEEAMRFGRILTNRYQSEERLPEGYIFTLPSEAQWEYACRAGTQTRFNTGDNIWNLEQAGWYRANSRGRTHPVGLKKPNEWGLYDMHGNVREWTRSWLGRYPGGVVSDFTGPAGGLLRVNRGGSWSITGQFCRSAYRHGNKPSFRYNNLGFRLALIPAF